MSATKSRLTAEEKQRILAEIAAAEAEVAEKAARAQKAQENLLKMESQMQQLLNTIEVTSQTVQEKIQIAAATKDLLQQSIQSTSLVESNAMESRNTSRPVTSQASGKSIAPSAMTGRSAEPPIPQSDIASNQLAFNSDAASSRPQSVQGENTSIAASVVVAEPSKQIDPIVTPAIVLPAPPGVPVIPIAVLSNSTSSKPAPPADGDERTPEQIFAYYKDRADQGHARSQYNVGVCYERGQGVERSERMAFQYYLRSSKQGFAFAEFSLGQCYLKGFGVGVNESKAIELFKKAAAQKLERAIEALRNLNVK